jgi:hypothetical protein
LSIRIIITTYFARVSRNLGYGISSVSVATSALFALTSFFYIYTAGSHFKIGTYILQNRITYATFFDFYIINKPIDQLIIISGIAFWLALSVKGKARVIVPGIYGGIILIGAITGSLSLLFDIAALISVPFSICLLVYNRYSSRKILNDHTNILIANYLAIIGFSIGILSVIIAVIPLLSAVRLEALVPLRNYAFEIFLLFSSLCPVLMFLLIACFPVKLLMKRLTEVLKIRNNAVNLASISNEMVRRRTKIICLSLSMVLSVAMVLIPHEPTISKDNQEIGVDTAVYVNRIRDLLGQSDNIREFIHKLFVTLGDRSITFIFLLTIVKTLPFDLSYTVDFIVPIILGPILVLVVYFLTQELTSNDATSLLSSFLTAVSFHTLIGIYAGFYANWLAIIVGYLMFVFLFRFLKTSSKMDFAIYSVLIVILLYSHVYTWSVLVIVVGVFLVAMLKLNYYSRRSMILLLSVALISVAIDVARITTTGSFSGIAQDISIANTGVGLEQFTLRWSNLLDTIHRYLGSQFSNFIVLVLGLYWLARSNLREPSTIFLVTFLSLGIVPLFFGNSLVQIRVLYDIPFQIPAAIGLTHIYRKVNGNIMLSTAIVWLIGISLRSVSNFYLPRP